MGLSGTFQYYQFESTFFVNSLFPYFIKKQDQLDPALRNEQGWIDFNTVHRKEFPDPLPVERLFMKECPNSTKTREVLRNPSQNPISKFPLGFSFGKPLKSQKISWLSGMDLPIPPLFWWSMNTNLNVL